MALTCFNKRSRCRFALQAVSIVAMVFLGPLAASAEGAISACIPGRTVAISSYDKASFAEAAARTKSVRLGVERAAEFKVGRNALVGAYPRVAFAEAELSRGEMPLALKRGIIDITAYWCDWVLSRPADFSGRFDGLNAWLVGKGQQHDVQAQDAGEAPQGQGGKSTCEDPTLRPDEKIRACTARLDAGALSTYNTAATLQERGLGHFRKGDYEAALRDFAAAIDILPDLGAVRYWRGVTYAELGRIEEAIADLEEAEFLAEGDMAQAASDLLDELYLAMPAPEMPLLSIGGVYSVKGTNPDGSKYSGTCKVTKVDGERYRFEWSVGGSYIGEGTLQQGVLTVDWGSDSPVVYKVKPDGTLEGTWAKGRAAETLVLKPDSPPIATKDALTLRQAVESCMAKKEGVPEADARCLLPHAVRLAWSVKETAYRDDALKEVGFLAAKIDAAAAREIAAVLPSGEKRDSVLSMIAIQLGKSAHFDDALEAAAKIEDRELRGTALAAISLSQVKAGKWQEGEKTAAGIEDDRLRRVAYRDHLVEWLKTRGFAGHERFLHVETIGDFAWNALVRVAEAQSKVGNPDVARRTLSEAVEAARRSALDRLDVSPLKGVADSQREAGLEEEALHTLRLAHKMARGFKDMQRKKAALLRVAYGYASFGMADEAISAIGDNLSHEERLDSAIAVADDFPEPRMGLAVLDFALGQADDLPAGKARFQDIAVLQAKLGAQDAAAQTFTKAVGHAETMKGTEFQSELRKIAEHCIEAGVIGGAEYLITQLTNLDTRRSVLAKITAAHWKKGLEKEARATLDQALDRGAPGWATRPAFWRVVQIMAENGVTPLVVETLEAAKGDDACQRCDFERRWAWRAVFKDFLKQPDLNLAIRFLDHVKGRPEDEAKLISLFLERTVSPPK